MTFQTGRTKAPIIPGEERSCGDWEREWATQPLLSSSVPICRETYFLNLIKSPSLPHATHFSWSKYEVEKILNSRIHWQKLQFEVKWEGWDKGQVSWEPAENIANAKEAIEEFYKENPDMVTEADIPPPNKNALTIEDDGP